MKLNFDCVRIVILTLENHLEFGKIMTIDDLMDYPLVQSFTEVEVAHSLSQLAAEEMIVCKIETYINGSLSCDVSDITPKGYKLCKALRDESILGKIKFHLEDILTITELLNNIISLAKN